MHFYVLFNFYFRISLYPVALLKQSVQGHTKTLTVTAIFTAYTTTIFSNHSAHYLLVLVVDNNLNMLRIKERHYSKLNIKAAD